MQINPTCNQLRLVDKQKTIGVLIAAIVRKFTFFHTNKKKYCGPFLSNSVKILFPLCWVYGLLALSNYFFFHCSSVLGTQLFNFVRGLYGGYIKMVFLTKSSKILNIKTPGLKLKKKNKINFNLLLQALSGNLFKM